MPNPSPVTAALAAAGVSFDTDVPLAKRTWWRVGGAADVFVEATDVVTLAAVQRAAHGAGVAVLPLGAGSNLLVSDRGVRGVVVQLAGRLADTAPAGDHVVAGGGLRLAVLLARARKQGWAGLEMLAGIPGTVGGSVRMNAGTSLGEIGDRVLWADLVLSDGTVDRVSAASLGFAYRATGLPPGALVARAALRTDGDAGVSAEAAARFLARRKATQPLDQPSCGSTFTNPPGDHAGRLIDAAGLKGFGVGGAQISTKHANFVVNTGDATADDLLAVIRHAHRTVLERFGVALRPEVDVVGDWSHDANGGIIG